MLLFAAPAFLVCVIIIARGVCLLIHSRVIDLFVLALVTVFVFVPFVALVRVVSYPFLIVFFPFVVMLCLWLLFSLSHCPSVLALLLLVSVLLLAWVLFLFLGLVVVSLFLVFPQSEASL